MGSQYDITCPECGYRQRLHLGVGMAYTSIEAVIDLVPHALREPVLQAIQQNPAGVGDFRHALYCCSDCQRRAGRFYFQVTDAGGRVIEPEYHCSRCRCTLTREAEADAPDLDDAPQDWPCPECGHQGLHSALTVLWD
ncbi:MAG: hypothetical protein GC168_21255 [Candidatus Hydrogenedens sp.]|nr:hypothetical protein [Candidatus Hydrogenedens sp.]